MMDGHFTRAIALLALCITSPGYSAEKHALFGELHVHTTVSFDAFVYNVKATPDDAYRYARGMPIQHTSGDMIQSARPIDFMAVTDHAEYLGVLPMLSDPTGPLADSPLARELASSDKAEADAAFARLASSLYNAEPLEELRPPALVRSNWQAVVDAAERHYRPGEFSTLVGYEWTSIPDHRNLHRNVIFRGGEGKVPDQPFSALDSSVPQDLWNYMDEVRARGMDVLAIPHNANLSDGRMFPVDRDERGEPLDADYAESRMRNEPLVEMSQIKGSSETHPALSPNDEWAGFEIVGELIGTGAIGKVPGSYVRRAYLDGLEMHANRGFNPYRFGMIGSTDSHNANVPSDENNYTGKTGISDDTPEKRRTAETGGLRGRTYSAAGLAGVWAPENTREAIFDALARKETFATSGPRIRLRMFAGNDYPAGMMSAADWAQQAASSGVAMGSTLVATKQSPVFLVAAQRDPEEAGLERLQVVKGWLEDGVAREKVFDVACATGAPDKASHRCGSSNARVDLSNCSLAGDRGANELEAAWQDPEFEPGQQAFYYSRVIQRPTCRWSTWDALRIGKPLLEDLPPTIQERAWSSPIWIQSAL
jgi:Protein of unknown function (DUF3604)